MMQPLLLGSQSYESRSMSEQGGRLINVYKETLPKDSSYPFLLLGRHGLVKRIDFNQDGKFIRGMREFNDFLYVVVGQLLYKVAADYTFDHINTGHPIFDDPFPVMMVDNGLELAILTTSGAYYVVDTSDVVTEPALSFSGTSMAYAYSRILLSAIEGNNVAVFYPGELVDASTFDAGLVRSANEVSDQIVRLYSYNNILYVMKQTSIEYFVVTEDADAPFQQVPSSTKTYVGLAGTFAVIGADKYLFWLGSDRKIYAGEGYDFTPISTPAIEQIIETFGTISDCNTYYWVESGHKFVGFDFKRAGWTFIYDIEEKAWHERTTFNEGRWQVAYATVFNGFTLFGSTEDCFVYSLERGVFDDDGEYIEAEMHTPPIGDGSTRLFFKKIQLNFKRGVGVVPDVNDPQVMLQYSDDGGRTWSTEQWRDLGAAGAYEGRCLWNAQGSSRRRVYKVRITDKVEKIITGMFGDIGKGLS